MSFTIVCVGSGDVGRSALTAALLARDFHRIWPRSADDLVVSSAGVDAVEGMPVAPNLDAVAAPRGLDLSTHTASPMSRDRAESADLVLTMTRGLRAQLILQYPYLRTRTFSLLEFLALLQNASAVRRRTPIGRGDRLETKLRLVTTAAAARHRAMPEPGNERLWDLFDPYAYSLEIYETVATALEAASHALVSDIAILTGAGGGQSAYRSA